MFRNEIRNLVGYMTNVLLHSMIVASKLQKGCVFSTYIGKTFIYLPILY